MTAILPPSTIAIGGATASGTLSTTEAKLGADLNYLINWGAMPGSRARAGIAGRFDVGVNPVTLRVRVGANEAHDGAVTGTVVAEVELPADTITDVGFVGDEFDYPTVNAGISRVMLTAQAVGGDTAFSRSLPGMTFTPADSGKRAVLVAGSTFIHAASVWSINFDVFDGATQLVVGLAYAVNTPGATHEIWVGGTEGSSPAPGFMDPAENGVLALTVALGGVRVGAMATIAKTLSGPQFVKLSLADSVGDASILIREA